MTGITFPDTSSDVNASAGGSGTISLSIPADTVTGDLLVVFVEDRNGLSSPASDWVQQVLWTATGVFAVYTYTVTGSPPGSPFTITCASGSRNGGVIFRVPGCDLSSPVSVVGTPSSAGAGTTATFHNASLPLIIEGVTVPTNGALLTFCASMYPVGTTPPSDHVPGATTFIKAGFIPTAGGWGVWGFTPDSGSTGNITTTNEWTSSGQGEYGVLIALSPAPSVSVSGSITLKKMTLSGISAEKSVASGTVRLKKMVLSGTSYRLWPSTNGPSSPVSYSGNFISGLVFAVEGGGNWFEGYWWWVCATGQSTSPVKCALWSVKQGSSPTGVLVPGSVVTSGTLTAGQWNYIPLASPLQLAPGWDANLSTNGSAYVAAIGCNGAFPDTNGYWSGPVSNGPLNAYSGNQGGDPNPPPYGLSQGIFSVAGSDPSTTMPGSASSIDNFWVDVQISDTAPSGYNGSYRLWPNKADSNVVVIGDAAFNYTVGTEIHLTQACTLNNVWYFSPAAATTLATQCDVWDISTGLSVASITSPSWTDAAGTTYTPPGTVSPPAGSGTWIKAAFAGGVALPVGSYIVTVYNSNGTSDGNWSPKDAATDYFGETFAGVGVNGITNGPLSAPGWSSASPGYLYGGSSSNTPPYSNGTVTHAQPVFGQTPGGLVDFPQLFAPVGGSSNESQNYWVDLEVTLPPSISGTINLKKMVLSGSSTEKSVVTGIIKLKKMVLSGGASAEKAVVTGAISLNKMVLSGASAEKAVVTGAVTLKKMVLSGASAEKAVVTGAISLNKMVLSGASAEKAVVTGAVTLKKMVLAGSGSISTPDEPAITGIIALKKMRLSGTSHEKSVVTGTIQLKKMRIHGSNEIDQHRVSPSFFVFSPL